MNNKKRKKIFIMTLWLLFVAVLLGSSSYAWFSTNRIVYINSMNVNVRAEGGIEISADAKNWKTILAVQDIIDVHNGDYVNSVNQIPDRLEPVSTGMEIDNNTGFLKMYYGQVDALPNGKYSLVSERNIETESNGVESDGKFIAFDIFIKTKNPTDLFLTTYSGAVYGGDNSVGIENAVRMAFLLQGNVNDDAALTTIQRLSNATEESSYIWEPNYDTHNIYGVQNAFNVYGLTTTTTDATRLPYDGIISSFDKNSSVTIDTANETSFANFFKRVSIDYETKTNFDENKKVFNIESGITKIRVYMWIEGQDVDCENNASVGNITFTLQFTSNRS